MRPDLDAALVRDFPNLYRDRYTTPQDVQSPKKVGPLAAFCRRMGRNAKQGEIGLVIADEYFPIRDYTEPKS